MKWNLLVSEGIKAGVMDLLHLGLQIRSATTDLAISVLSTVQEQGSKIAHLYPGQSTYLKRKSF
jgi:hypothetical protein